LLIIRWVEDHKATTSDLTNLEVTVRLQYALDQNYRQILEKARSEFERKFAGPDPSDASVSVRIKQPAPGSPGDAKPRAGFRAKKSRRPSGKTLKRFA
jgi:hypothetical protein